MLHRSRDFHKSFPSVFHVARALSVASEQSRFDGRSVALSALAGVAVVTACATLPGLMGKTKDDDEPQINTQRPHVKQQESTGLDMTSTALRTMIENPAGSWMSVAQCHAPQQQVGGMEKKSLPEYTREEVAKHKTRGQRVWVTYRDGVYDVTEWLDQHPGGASRLMLAAGGAIDPFWAMYAQVGQRKDRNLAIYVLIYHDEIPKVVCRTQTS